MAQVFARIELRGNPSADIYERLHEHMRKLNWFPTITGLTGTSALPHATYQATFQAVTDLPSIATQLKAGIEANVWTKALVLVIDSLSWAVTAG